MVFFQCDHPGCMGVLRAAAQKQEQQRMATLEILQVRMGDLYRSIFWGEKIDIKLELIFRKSLRFESISIGSMWFG